MKKIITISLILVLLFTFSGCELISGLFGGDSLQVMFVNKSNSAYKITSLQIKEGGKSSKAFEISPPADWSPNLLKAGETLDPGKHFYFDVDMPSGNFCYFRITVNDTTDGVSGNDLGVITLEYATDNSNSPLRIDYWGGNTRTVAVAVNYSTTWNELYNGVYVSSTINSVGWDNTLGTTEVSW